MAAACKCAPDPNLYVPRLAQLEEVMPQTEAEALFRFRFEDGSPLGHRPGQFVQVCLPGIGEAPISVASAPCEDPTFELCVRQLGNVTGALHHLQAGAFVGFRGPFGNGFPDDQLKGQDILIVAGGIGLVPLRPLIHHIMCNRFDYGEFTLLYGMKAPGEMLFKDEVREWQESAAVDLRMTVDRPHPDWSGHVGVITTLFPDVQIEAAKTRAVIVGPPIMYRFVLMECHNKGLADEHLILSLERHMKCGVGKCGHCQINGKYVCKEGPVFTYHEMKQMWEAV
jgi:sulfite reductase subunit B